MNSRPRRNPVPHLIVLNIISLLLGIWAGGNYLPRHIHHGMSVERFVIEPGDADEKSIELWKIEVARRFPDALLVVSHGTDINGEWWITPHGRPGMKAQAWADMWARLHPDRIIVLISCNPGGRVINTPNVYYALNNVWYEPEKDWKDWPKSPNEEFPGAVGNIFEFVTGRQ